MPQYSNTSTSTAGYVVNVVLNTETNLQTITVSGTNGYTATATQPGTFTRATSATVNSLVDSLIQDPGNFNANVTDIGSAIRSASTNVVEQARRAQVASTVSNQPVPDAPQPPPPVTAADNPNPLDPNTNLDVVVTPIPINNENTDAVEVQPETVTSPVSVTENVFDPGTTINAGEENVFDPGTTFNTGEESVFDPTGNNGNTGALNETRGDAVKKDAESFEKAKDWRVRLSLAPSAKYLYKNKGNEGILGPLAATNGVIFPYTPTISVVYAASYDASELVHSNYKIYNYKSSNVDTVTITGDFTAQDTNEANYLLAVIHFFKSVTKMFYGQDQNPRNGTPPPLVYMSGMGTFQFDNHPLAVTNFTYSLPNEVDYIRAGSVTTEPGSSTAGQTPVNNTDSASEARIQSSGLGPRTPNFQRAQATINSNATYVPTKMQIVITCIPIVTRNDISNNFSLRDYATGALLQGSKRNGGGIW